MIEDISYQIVLDDSILSEDTVNKLKSMFKNEIDDYNKLSWFKKMFAKSKIKYKIKFSRWTNCNDKYEKIICDDGYTIAQIINAISMRTLFLKKFNR